MKTNPILTLFAISQAVREMGGTVWLHHCIKGGGYLFRATVAKKNIRLSVPAPGSSDAPIVPPEANSPLMVVRSIAELKNWLQNPT
jgi:hypothetical protein